MHTRWEVGSIRWRPGVVLQRCLVGIAVLWHGRTEKGNVCKGCGLLGVISHDGIHARIDSKGIGTLVEGSVIVVVVRWARE